MKKTPKLRFKGFEEEWEEKKLEEIANINPKCELPNTFEYVDLESVVGTIMRNHRTEHKESAPSRAQRLAQQGDIFYQMVRPYQRNNYFFNEDSTNYVFSSGYAQIRPSIDSGFLFTKLQSDSFLQQVLLNCVGTSFPAINPSSLSKLEVCYPTDKTEQQRIASYFTHLDTLIEASRQKVEKYKQVKAASLQALFPQHGERVPKLRFKGYEREWKKVELGEIGTFLKGQGYSKADITDKGTPLFLYGRLYTNYSFVTTNVDTFANKQEGSVISEGNEIIIPASGETAEDIVRASAILSKGIILGGDLNIIRIDTNIYDPAFVALSISYGSTHNELSKSAQGKTVVHLHNSEIKKGVIKIPSLQEQHLIAQYFTNLDSLLTLEQLRYEKLQQVKRASLSQMFA